MRSGLKWLVRIVGSVLMLALVAVGGAYWYAGHANRYQTSGEMTLPALDAPVTVIRDRRGVPYIRAESFRDVIRAQGFVVAQDRLFQMEMAKRAALGRLSELFGDATLLTDTDSRVIGFHRIAEDHWRVLDDGNKQVLSDFAAGLNAYITLHAEDHPWEFRLVGAQVEPWSETDLMAVMLYFAWQNGANFSAEIATQSLVEAVGPERAAEVAPLTINPDEPRRASVSAAQYQSLDLDRVAAGRVRPVRQSAGMGGSNAWAMGGARSPSGAAVVANDPHLDVRNLPGLWHPVGLITPGWRAVGVGGGLPGISAGRNERLAWGVTNGYADVVDLYVETPDPTDPSRYLEGSQSVPFRELQETIKVKDGEAHVVTVRLTTRGPVISDHDWTPFSDRIISARWAVAEYPQADLGLRDAMQAQSVDEALTAWGKQRMFGFSMVFGDADGRTARLSTGAAPIRVRGDGSTPALADGEDRWAGLIPASEMPRHVNPAQGWAGSANQFVQPDGYPYPFTTYASPTWRYERLQELLGATGVLGVKEHYDAQRDDKNVFARSVAPIMAAALAEDDVTAPLAAILGGWDHHDGLDSSAPTVFQATYRHFARRVFRDELGDATEGYLGGWYVWQQRLHAMVLEGDTAWGSWFDDASTPQRESRDDLFRLAAKDAIDELTATYGAGVEHWHWGNVRSMRRTGPLRLDGLAGRLTGAQAYPQAGSGETLNRALFDFSEPGFDPRWTVSFRMVADLGDADKVLGVLPGGVVGRTRHPQLDDQIEAFHEGHLEYLWFSDAMIEQNAASELSLRPR
ncbi:MAG: penicillin acylase family protein [Pseudomonadota bacterium]